MRLLLSPILLCASNFALAYIGPGAGVSFLGSIWAVLVGILLAVVAVLIWPIRYLIRRMRARLPADSSEKPSAEK